jgi:hypothetical protein
VFSQKSQGDHSGGSRLAYSRPKPSIWNFGFCVCAKEPGITKDNAVAARIEVWVFVRVMWSRAAAAKTSATQIEDHQARRMKNATEQLLNCWIVISIGPYHIRAKCTLEKGPTVPIPCGGFIRRDAHLCSPPR